MGKNSPDRALLLMCQHNSSAQDGRESPFCFNLLKSLCSNTLHQNMVTYKIVTMKTFILPELASTTQCNKCKPILLRRNSVAAQVCCNVRSGRTCFSTRQLWVLGSNGNFCGQKVGFKATPETIKNNTCALRLALSNIQHMATLTF